MEIEKLNEYAKEVRKQVLMMINKAKSGHPGGSLSCVDILVSLYFELMNLNEDSDGRIDKFILSKGHAAPAYYAVLGKKGFIDEDELMKLRKIDSHIEGHPTNKINGVDVSSGSLGQGLSVAVGMALSKKIYKKEGYVYCLLGDGEIEEGQVWEAMMSASKNKLNNLVVFVDNNKLQIDGSIHDVKGLENIKEKVESFGLYVCEVDGHDIEKIITSVNEAKKQDKPICIICDTIKGKGVSFMENQVSWHGKAPNDEELEKALKELK